MHLAGLDEADLLTTAISPWQTKAAPHWMKNYIFNGYRRLSGEVVFFAIPFAIGVSRDALRYCFFVNHSIYRIRDVFLGKELR
jgi:hypothetical protein